jgi:hypothetical protein
MVAALLAALAAGLFARLFQIELQIPMDDEWHAIAKAASSSYREIVLSFGLADHSIPVTLFYRWLIAEGRLSEAWMYALPLVAGIATCIGLVGVARSAVSPLALGLFASLIAVSPLLVLYSRQARPYAMSLFLALASAWAAWRWWKEGKFRHAALYLACAPLAIWFHMIVAPFVLGVWVVFLLEWVADARRDTQRLAAMAIMGGTAVLLTAVLIGPPIVNDLANLRAKASQDFPGIHTVERTAAMYAGTASSIPALVMALLAAPGIVVLLRARPQATRYVLALIALQAGTVLASHAYLLHYPLVLARYLLVCLPFFLLAAAAGAAFLIEPLGRRWRWLPWSVGAAAVAGLVVAGPLPGALAYPDSFFGHHIHFLEFDDAENPVVAVLRPGPMPEFYRRLGTEPAGSRTVIEAPWRYESIFNRLPYFQQVHRQRVKVGMVGGLCPPGGHAEQPRQFRNEFRNVVDLARAPERLRAEADYVVFHRVLDLPNLEGPWLLPGGRSLPAVDACIARFARNFGPPVFEDATITVFALARR